MRRSGNIVSYTADEIDEMIARGEDRTDWARVDAMTEEELEASIDHEEEGEIDWSSVTTTLPVPKQQVTVRIDGDVIDWFKAHGPGYQTRMNAVLRAYVEAKKRQPTKR
jgi:uncharacterized protein (DUF4415 family)